MGTFLGHAVPGTFFFCFSLWWTWCMFHRYFICRRHGEERRKKSGASSSYRNVFAFRTSRFFSGIPVEGSLKLLAAVLGMIGEFATGFENGHFKHLNNAQHMTMFFFFGLNGVIDMLQHYQVPLLPDMDYMTGILALAMEALLFFYHLHGRSPMDKQVHMLLFYVIVSSAVTTALEMRYKKSILPALGRTYFIMLQGTWFYQIGFILYSPIGSHWDTNSHNQMMIVTLIFAWHNAGIFAFLFAAGVAIYFRVKSGSYLFSVEYPISAHSVELTSGVSSSKIELELTKGILSDSEDDEDIYRSGAGC